MREPEIHFILPNYAGTGGDLQRAIQRLAANEFSVTSSASALCPDLLRYEQIGEADNMRGRVVRAFFWLMRAWPV